MQRLTATALFLLLSFSLIMPMLRASDDSQIPECCRRSGNHHCLMMQHHAPAPPGVSIGVSAERCPFATGVGVVPIHSYSLFPAPLSWSIALAMTHPSRVAQTEAQYRISFSRSRQKRGPPSLV